MSYTPTEWSNGDIITAEKLNKLEESVQEVSDSLFTIHIIGGNTPSDAIFDKTFQEIFAAVSSGKFIRFIEMGIENYGIESCSTMYNIDMSTITVTFIKSSIDPEYGTVHVQGAHYILDSNNVGERGDFEVNIGSN